jgi:ketosteroid isomerase-like protein
VGAHRWRLARAARVLAIDPAGDASADLAGQLSTTWTQAYNGGDAKALAALYANDAMLSSVQDGTFTGRDSILSFWTGDLGGAPTSTLTLSDAYVAGDLAHLEGEYKVEEKGRPVTTGRYTQLWMREGSDWRIHRELWWR